MSQLVDDLIAAGPRLNQRVLGEMYADPFWDRRFGERGRGHAKADGDFHIKYVVSAIEADDPALFVTYGRWLRDVLVSRGMCSRHLADHFERLADAITDEPWPDRERPIEILRGGAAGLVHTGGDAGALDAHRRQLADTIAGDQPAQVHADAVHLLSYLADALATGQRDGLDGFVRYLVATHPLLLLCELLGRLTDQPALPDAARGLVLAAAEAPR